MEYAFSGRHLSGPHMKIQSPLALLLQSALVGLAVAAVLLLWRPDLFRPARPVVEIVQSGAPVQARATASRSYADAVKLAAPAVVNIYSQKEVAQHLPPMFDDPRLRRFFGDDGRLPRKRLETSLGSGVIVSSQGYILTNNHVIEGADEIEVALHDGRTTRAALVGADPESDLAVLRIHLAHLPAITLGHSRALQVGDVVLAIGNPFGVGQTVTQGIVSATGRSRIGLSTFEDFIQTDAAINPGNSGGALVNTDGDLVGINTAIFSRSGGSQGIGFAIPVSLARGVMAQLIATGHVSRGWLGIEVQRLTPELAASFGLKQEKGVLVAGVLKGGPAQRAGLQPGDVITTLNGAAVADVRTALTAITHAPPGSRMAITGRRDGKTFHLDARVGQRPSNPH